MAITLRNCVFTLHTTSLRQPSLRPCPNAPLFLLSINLSPPTHHGRSFHASTSKTASPAASDSARIIQKVFCIPPGVDQVEVYEDMVLPGSNVIAGPYVGHAQIKEVELVKSSGRAKDCPKVGRPEFAILGRSKVCKPSLINTLVLKKEAAVTSKKPGKTQLINHFLVNKSWYIVDFLKFLIYVAAYKCKKIAECELICKFCFLECCN
ncbi:GTP-binding protein At2g22870-like [Syzygium oleosum]|uniref:GTP-binding protein At2g22870-like n=1 Tax=Syzygium oleosum TaxID=219896 RepID=UPI0011D28CB1|nr:GTP-binding protein At2g22870-like [Syzygium oleosum]